MLAVAATTFSVVTAEMLPVGLLTPIGATLRVSDGAAGLTLTATGLVAALAAPVVPLTARRADRRLVLAGLMVLLAAANLLAAWAPVFGVLLLARVLVGLGMGGVWAVAASLAVRLVPARSVAPATAAVFSGIAVASVVGVPAGTLVGELAGWRAAFALMAAVSLAVAAALALLLPPLPADGRARPRELAALVRAPRLRTGLLVVLLLVAGHFAAYTYVRPVLEELSGIATGLLSVLLLAYGVAGIAGNFLAGATVSRRADRTLLVLCAGLAAAMLATPLLGTSAPGAVVLLLVWGLAYGGVSVAAQTWLLALTPGAPGARETASALFASVFNIAISMGALLGGRAADALGEPGVMWLGGALALLALGVAWPRGGRPRGRGRWRKRGRRDGGSYEP
ncbi:MFS transporter [Streptomyces sp. NPDC054796]